MSARAEGQSWAAIASRFGVSARQARRIVKDVGSASDACTVSIDAAEIIEAAILRCEAIIADLAEIADSSTPMVAVRAIQAQIRATEHEIELLRNVGILSAPGANLAHQAELQRVAQQAVEVLNRHEVPAVVKSDLLAALHASSRGAARPRLPEAAASRIR